MIIPILSGVHFGCRTQEPEYALEAAQWAATAPLRPEENPDVTQNLKLGARSSLAQ